MQFEIAKQNSKQETSSREQASVMAGLAPWNETIPKREQVVNNYPDYTQNLSPKSRVVLLQTV